MAKESVAVIRRRFALEAAQEQLRTLQKAFPELSIAYSAPREIVVRKPREAVKDGRSHWSPARKKAHAERMRKMWTKRNQKKGVKREQATKVSGKTTVKA